MTMTDAELLDASRRGEHQAFGALVERYQRVVSAVSFSRTRDQALSEDIAQETFIAAWRQLDQLREPKRLRSWLCGIARNLARKASRRNDREVLEEAEAHTQEGDNPFDVTAKAEADRVVADALARVPESYRDVLVLYYGEQLSVREVADSLGISEAATLQRLSRGRQNLANGVTQLVESALRAQRPKRDLVARVLAALPPIAILAPSPVEASSSHQGGSMFKLAIAGAAFVAAATTAVVVVAKSSDSTPTPTPSTQTSPAITAKPRVAQAPTIVAKGKAPTAAPTGSPDDPPAHLISPEPDTTRVVDSALAAKLKLDTGPSRGPVGAPITITMFTDLQCKYCGIAHASIDQLFDDYPGKIRLVIKQMPVHKTAVLAAEAAYAAEAQGKFWELDELMIANPDDLSRDKLIELGKQAGLDIRKLEVALDKHTYASAVEDDVETAKALEFFGTPSFVINGRRIQGALPVDELKKTIEASLKD